MNPKATLRALVLLAPLLLCVLWAASAAAEPPRVADLRAERTAQVARRSALDRRTLRASPRQAEVREVPEIDTTWAGAGAVLLFGGVLLLSSRRRCDS